MAALISADGNIGGGGNRNVGDMYQQNLIGSASLYPVILPLELAALAGE